MSEHLRYRRIGLLAKEGLPHLKDTVERVLSVLRRLGAEICLDPDIHAVAPAEPSRPFHECGDALDAVLVIGGDGTILRAVRRLPYVGMPILSVNRGAVGFLAEVDMDEVEVLLPQLLSGGGVEEKRSLIAVSVRRDGAVGFEALALNEAVISQGTISRLLDLRASVSGEHLATYHADGLILSTPTGSTAYSLAAGGPIVHPRLSAMILTPISPHSLTQRPIVIPGDSRIEVEVMKRNIGPGEHTVGLTVDGQIYHPLQAFDTIHLSLHDESVTFIRRKEDTFFRRIRRKLKWGEGLED